MFVRIHIKKHHTDIKQLKEPESCGRFNKMMKNKEKCHATLKDTDKNRQCGRAQLRM